MTSIAVSFECDGERLHGVLERPASAATTAVLIAVGGPQYRVGSNRQFVLLARALAQAGFASLRFDYRGMGDSEGEARDFEAVAADLDAAVTALQALCPPVRRVVVWGLCDAATAAVLHLADDPRITGVVLVNPWVRTEIGRSRTLLTDYYGGQVRDWAAWRQILRDPRRLLRAVVSLATTALGALPFARGGAAVDASPLPDRLLRGLERFRGGALIIICGDDLTAAEFVAATRRSARWRRRIEQPSVTWRNLPEANHTFSTAAWRGQVFSWTLEWLAQENNRAS